MNWPRVSRKRRCLVCGRGDWCTFNDRGSGCMRVESQTPMRNGGWWHPNNLSGEHQPHKNESTVPVHHAGTTRRGSPAQTLDCDTLLHEWQQSQNGQLEPFASTVGVSQDALRALGCVWAVEHRAFAFPMYDSRGKIIGIRLRTMEGKKFAVKGSRQGLFMTTVMAESLASRVE